MAQTETTEVVAKDCARCGAPVRMRVPKLGEFARGISRGLSVTCTSCSERLEAEETRAERAKRFVHLLDASGLPAELRDLAGDFSDLDADEPGRDQMIGRLKGWANGMDGGNKTRVLVGPVGTGKTRLAATAAIRKMQLGVPMRYISVARLITMDRAGFGTEEKAEATRVLLGRTGLVLDDLDKVKPTPDTMALLFQAIDSRDQAGKSLVVTSNLTLNQIAETYGDPIASRLSRPGSVIEVVGRDRRGDGG